MERVDAHARLHARANSAENTVSVSVTAPPPWIRPQLVAEIGFTERREYGMLRRPRSMGPS
jgi:hypothetical protein